MAAIVPVSRLKVKVITANDNQPAIPRVMLIVSRSVVIASTNAKVVLISFTVDHVEQLGPA